MNREVEMCEHRMELCERGGRGSVNREVELYERGDV